MEELPAGGMHHSSRREGPGSRTDGYQPFVPITERTIRAALPRARRTAGGLSEAEVKVFQDKND